MKLSKILDSRFKSGLQKLIAADLPLRVAFNLKGILATVNTALKTYDEVRLEALKRYADKKEDGSIELDDNKNVKINPENYEKFANELTELVATEIEVGKIKLADLGDNVRVSVDELGALEDLLEP